MTGNIMWFGKAWSEHGIPVDCVRVDTPVGEPCIECTTHFRQSDRGVLTLCSTRVWGGFPLAVGGSEVRVCGYHLKCWLGLVVGNQLSSEVTDRMPGRRDELAGMLGHRGEEVVHDKGGWRKQIEVPRGENVEGTAEDPG